MILTVAQAREILSTAEKAWHDRDVEALVAALHPEVRICFNDQSEICGLGDARAWLSRRMATQQDYRLRKTLRGLDGPLIVSSWTGRWRNADTGQVRRGRGIELLTLDGGLIRDWDAVLHAWTDSES